MKRPRFALVAGMLATLALLGAAAGCRAFLPWRQADARSDHVVGDQEALIDLIENPRLLAVFPLTNRTAVAEIGAVAEEVLLAEMSRLYLWDGALVTGVRDALLSSGYRWTETADPVVARQIARRLGASLYLIGSVDEYSIGDAISLSGTLRLNRVSDDQPVFTAVYSAVDDSILRDRIAPRELLRRGLGRTLERLAEELSPKVEARIAASERQLRERMAGLEEHYGQWLESEEKPRLAALTGLVADTTAARIPRAAGPAAEPALLKLRRLSQAQSAVRDFEVTLHYRDQLARLLAKSRAHDR